MTKDELLKYLKAYNHACSIVDYFASGNSSMSIDSLFNIIGIIYQNAETALGVPWSEIKDIIKETLQGRMILIQNIRIMVSH